MLAPLLWIHIPKTAGTTLKKIIQRSYAPDEYRFLDRHWLIQNTSDEAGYRFTGPGPRSRSIYEPALIQRELSVTPNIKLLQGHFPWGIHRELDLEVRYAVLLRNPLDRVLSEFRHAQRPEHYLHDQVRDMSLVDYVTSGLSLSTDNAQVRFLSGCYYEVEFGELTDEHLSQAIKNLHQTELFGLTERFAQMMGHCVDKPEWKTRHCIIPKQRTAKGKRRLSTHEASVILNHNKLDLELWVYAAHHVPKDYNMRSLVIKAASSLL
jgi:hypothetical protein